MSGLAALIALALGLALCVLWWPAVWTVLQGVLALSLVFWGLVALLVHHARNKAHREMERADRLDPTDSSEVVTSPAVEANETA